MGGGGGGGASPHRRRKNLAFYTLLTISTFILYTEIQKNSFNQQKGLFSSSLLGCKESQSLPRLRVRGGVSWRVWDPRLLPCSWLKKVWDLCSRMRFSRFLWHCLCYYPAALQIYDSCKHCARQLQSCLSNSNSWPMHFKSRASESLVARPGC